MDRVKGIADEAIASLGISRSIRSVYVEGTDSPWNEKALIKRKGGGLDVKITVWRDEAFLPGRVFRLFLYILDVLDPLFQYDPKLAPDEEKEPEITARYNQIWSLYVDSRMERRGVENFFDWRTRRNLFIGMEKRLSWEEGKAVFQKLWTKPSFTYPEIIGFSRHLDTLKNGPAGPIAAPEVEIAARIDSPGVREHIERAALPEFRNLLNEVLSFTAYHCKDCFMGSSYYGIFFVFQRRVFVELIPTPEDLLYFTCINPESNVYETEALTTGADLTAVQKRVRDTYHAILARSHPPV